MNNIALKAFHKARDAGEQSWHTVSSILVPYLAASGRYTVYAAIVTLECLELASERLLKVRFRADGKLEFKLA